MKFFIKAAVLTMLIVLLTFSACGGGGSSGNGTANGGPGPDGGIIISAEDGGTINYNNSEISFVVPENSLLSDTEIKIEPLTDIPAGGADGLEPYGQAYRFSPGGTEFEINTPAVMEMKYDEALLTQKGYSPDTLSLYYYDEEQKSYVAVSTIVDKDSKKLIANIEHFTIYVPMAKAKLTTNNVPYAALQNPVPNPIRAGAPILVRATVRDYDGSISGAKLYYRKLQPSAGAWNEAAMLREIRLNVADTYGYIIPASFLNSSDLGTGNDIEYYVKATDNLGTTSTTAVRSLNITRIYNPGTLTITPAVLNISAGFERSFTVRGKDTGGTTFTLVPENLSLSSSSGTLKQYYAGGVYYKAQTVTTSADKLSVGFGTESKTADINVYAGEITSIEILDTNGQQINGIPVIPNNTSYEFDAVGYDDYGNKIPILPIWSADPVVGTINSDGLLTANFTGAGKINITLGSHSYEQIIDYKAVTGVTLDLTSINIIPGETKQLTATVFPADATNKDVIWTCSNTSIATVSSSGLVTGVADGNFTITVTTADQNRTAVCTAVCASTFSVTYNSNGGIGTIPTDTNLYTFGQSVTVKANINLVKTAMFFAGWNTAIDGSGISYALKAAFPMGNANVALYAKWIVGSDYISPNIGTLKFVPAGSFQRDFTSTNISTITTPFRMSEKEITRVQYSAVMGTDPSLATYSSGTSDPVQKVTWYDTVEFCNKLSILESLTPVYTITGRTPATGYPITSATVTANWSASGYRLPTEMEWMWAAMGATSGFGYTSPTYLTGYGKLFAGSDSVLANGTGGTRVIGDYAVFGYSYDVAGVTTTNRTNPVGSKLANELGLYDMSGNVFEWCWDLYGAYSTLTQTDYLGAASGTPRVMRGSGFNTSGCTVAGRGILDPNSRNMAVGFRVVRP